MRLWVAGGDIADALAASAALAPPAPASYRRPVKARKGGPRKS